MLGEGELMNGPVSIRKEAEENWDLQIFVRHCVKVFSDFSWLVSCERKQGEMDLYLQRQGDYSY